MAALDSKKAADVVTYRYLLAVKQFDESFADAGNVKIKDLYYWNTADPEGSRDRGELLAWGLNNACIKNAKAWGATFLGSAEAHAAAMSKMVVAMQTPENVVSDIAASLTTLFDFKSAAAVSKGMKL